MDGAQADRTRVDIIDAWEQAAPGWGAAAARVRDSGMAASTWMLDHLDLQPGHRVLELAAGPGDTGFLAAELIQPGGTLVCSDAAPAMLEVARERSRALGVENVEFALLQLEWIDLPTASVDAVLCRWGLMFAVDPTAAVREMRRVLRAGGRAAVAVWDAPQSNPWATIPQRALVELGHMEAPDPGSPGMFALASPRRLAELFDETGFTDVAVEAVSVPRRYANVEEYLRETTQLSTIFARHWSLLNDGERQEVRERIASLAAPLATDAGALELPGRSLVAAANA